MPQAAQRRLSGSNVRLSTSLLLGIRGAGRPGRSVSATVTGCSKLVDAAPGSGGSGGVSSFITRCRPAALAFLCLSAAPLAPAQAAQFWSKLDRDGPLSAGWVQVLPALSAACNFRIDSGKLSYTLIDLSTKAGNLNYTADLYGTLYQIEQRRAQNRFVQLWNTSFRGDQAAACATAERLWGAAGSQFSGVLVRDASADATSTVGQPRANNCQ